MEDYCKTKEIEKKSWQKLKWISEHKVSVCALANSLVGCACVQMQSLCALRVWKVCTYTPLRGAQLCTLKVFGCWWEGSVWMSSEIVHWHTLSRCTTAHLGDFYVLSSCVRKRFSHLCILGGYARLKVCLSTLWVYEVCWCKNVFCRCSTWENEVR